MFIRACFLIFVAAINSISAIEEDFYWQHYDGSIPRDALPVGDKSGKTMYVGQVRIEYKVYVGKIFLGDENLYYECQRKSCDNSISPYIFCTKHPEHFEWVATTNDDALELSSMYVTGGYDSSYSAVFIGRRQLQEETNVGQVFCQEYKCVGLYAVLNETVVTYAEYEILAYDFKYNRRC